MILAPFIAPNTGAEADAHVIQRLTLDYAAGTRTTALLASYLSQEAFSEGLFPLYMQEVRLDGVLPPPDQDPLLWAESQLVQAAPDDTSAVGNRYVFAGGEVVAS
jgi:hypothetical protein